MGHRIGQKLEVRSQLVPLVPPTQDLRHGHWNSCQDCRHPLCATIFWVKPGEGYLTEGDPPGALTLGKGRLGGVSGILFLEWEEGI